MRQVLNISLYHTLKTNHHPIEILFHQIHLMTQLNVDDGGLGPIPVD